MTKRNKILSGVVLASLLTTSLYAQYQNKENSCNYMKKEHKMYKRGHNKKGMPILSMFKKLNLSKEQKNSIKDIIRESKKNTVSINLAFTKNSFDKAKFIEIMKQKRENMIKSKAEILEKAYSVLTLKQKEQLKVLMELKQEKMQSFKNKQNG